MAAAIVVPPGAVPKVTGPENQNATRPSNPLPQWLIDSARGVPKVDFDPAKHVEFKHPNRIYSMKEFGLDGAGISPNAMSEPFSLFTKEAIQQMRAELFSDAVLESSQYASTFAQNMIRGFGPSLAPFIFDAWHSPAVLDAVSKVAGIELVPALETDTGHTNISLNDEREQGWETVPVDDQPTFSWHFDSYAFVCVVMLSDCTNMKGGETAVRTQSGEVLKMRGPTMGTAVVMQGRYIEHSAMKACGGRERVAMATPFRPKSPFVRDDTVLTGTRSISCKSELYKQYTEYRLEVLEERIRAELKRLRLRDRARRDFDTISTKQFISEQKEYLQATLNELVD